MFKKLFSTSKKPVKNQDQNHREIKSRGSSHAFNVPIISLNTSDRIYKFAYNNPIVNMAVNKIAKATAQADINFVDKDNEFVDLGRVDPKVRRLWEKPNLKQTKHQFIKAIVKQLLLFSRVCILKNPNGTELVVIPEGNFTVDYSNNPFMPIKGFEINFNEKNTYYKVNPVTGECNVLYIAEQNPNSLFEHHYEIEAIAQSINIVNYGLVWNSSLLNNGAKFSALVSVESKNELTRPSEEQISDVYEKMMASYAGASNAGKVFMGQDLKIQQASFSPKDMDYAELIRLNAFIISHYFDCPKQLVGVDEASTYNNLKEARLALTQHGMMPVLKYVINFLNDNVVEPISLGSYKLKIDEHSIPIIAEDRIKQMGEAEKLTFINDNEKRKQYGLPEVDGLDSFYKPSSYEDVFNPPVDENE